MKSLPIDFQDLAEAFENSLHDYFFHLDTETGEVVRAGSDYLTVVEEHLHAGELPVQDEPPDLKPLLAPNRLSAWELGELEAAYRVHIHFPGRLIAIPQQSSADAYADMQAFIETVTHPHLAVRLQDAIRGRGAFRRFKDRLIDYPAERERWFAFKDARLQRRIVAWLASENIEVTALTDRE
jgi:hypothetical protein